MHMHCVDPVQELMGGRGLCIRWWGGGSLMPHDHPSLCLASVVHPLHQSANLPSAELEAIGKIVYENKIGAWIVKGRRILEFQVGLYQEGWVER